MRHIIPLFYFVTGVRPMRWNGSAFVDVVSGKTVHCVVDAFGRYWLFEHPWARFRVETGTKD